MTASPDTRSCRQCRFERGDYWGVDRGHLYTPGHIVAEYLFTAGRDTAREHDAAVKGATWGADDSGSADAKLLLHKGEIE